MTRKELAEDIVSAIEQDLDKPYQAWDGLDPYERREIRRTWRRLVLNRIESYCEQMEVE